jgi:mitogen-activated protein kinase kinase kinase
VLAIFTAHLLHCCVLISQLPWADFENQFQIMYQLGSQKAPPVPDASLKPDGHDFLKRCFIPEPNKRWKAIQLLGHNFVKV